MRRRKAVYRFSSRDMEDAASDSLRDIENCLQQFAISRVLLSKREKQYLLLPDNSVIIVKMFELLRNTRVRVKRKQTLFRR